MNILASAEVRRQGRAKAMDGTKVVAVLPKEWRQPYLRLLHKLEGDIKKLPEYNMAFKLLSQDIVYKFILHRKDMLETGEDGNWKYDMIWLNYLQRLNDIQYKVKEKRYESNIFAAMASVLEEKVGDEEFRKDLLGSIVRKLAEIKNE